MRLRGLIVGLAIVVALGASPALAEAESVHVSASASPTQDVPMTVTVTGEVSAGQKLFVFVSSGIGSCPDQPDDDYGTALASGTALSAGSYREEYSFTPTETETYTVCGYLDTATYETPTATGSTTFEAELPSATSSITLSASPTQDVPLTVKVTGSTEVSRYLYVFVDSGAAPCPSMPGSNYGTTLASEVALPAGSYSKEYSFTPPEAEKEYQVCSYVDEGSYSTPDASGAATFESARPSASSSITLSASPTQDVPMTVQVTGSSEVSRYLYVFVDTGSMQCPSTPGSSYGTTLANEVSVPAGSYSKEYSFTPPEAVGYRVCAYVDEGGYSTPNATATSAFTASRPTASLTLTVSPEATEDGAVTVGVSGSTEVPRDLYVVAAVSASCASTPDENDGSNLVSGEELAAGSFNHSYSFTPDDTGTYVVCAYVDEGGYGTPDANAGGKVVNVTPEDRKLEEERAAKEAAAAAEKAAEAKKREEEKARKQYEKEAPGREAARKAAKLAAEREAAQKKPVHQLILKAVAHRGKSSHEPGYTELRLTTAPFADVALTLRRQHKHTWRYVWGKRREETVMILKWSCAHPGGAYRYTVQAHTAVGKMLTRSGRFHTSSASLCATFKRQEAEARERREREARESRERHEREAREEYEREAREERESLGRFERNCKRLGGKPVVLEVDDEYETYCRAPGGGTIPVPY